MADPLTLVMIGSGLGTLVSAGGALAGGEAANSEAKFKAAQLEQKGNEERAAGQRQMEERRREKELTQSRLLAGAAASSGDTTDTGILNLGGDIEARGEYAALTELYKGENAARGYQDMASAARLAGENAKTGSYFKAGGTLLEGVSSMAGKYKSMKSPSKTGYY